jgi:hypothetical protein
MMSNNTEYEKRSYEDLSLEFQKLYPSAARAFELIPLMYNRLTLVDKLSHKEAFTKIHDDHKHLSGFSTRNIRRYLSSDNPITPRRVRLSCPKNSFAEIIEPAKSSITQQEQSQPSLINHQETTLGDNNNPLQEESNEKRVDRNQIAEAVADLKLKALVSEQREEAVKRQTAIKTVDQISTTEIQYRIPKEKYPQLTAAIESSTNSVYVTFDNRGILERAEPDTFREKLDNA